MLLKFSFKECFPPNRSKILPKRNLTREEEKKSNSITFSNKKRLELENIYNSKRDY